MIDFVAKRYWYFLLSVVILVPGIISLFAFGLKPSIEFSSGSTMTVQFDNAVNLTDLRSEMAALGHGDAVVQSVGQSGKEYLLRTRTLEPEQKDAQGNVIPSEKEAIEEALTARFGALKVVDYYSVSPTVASEIVQKTLFAAVIAAVGILLYITWAFRKVAKSFRYGVSAIIALAHDVILVVGTFALLGKLFNIEVDAMFIVGVLTVMGYSVHDTIVVFDRIRENLKRGTGYDLETTVNNSIMETLGRSLNTSLTTLFVLFALFLFGGTTIRNFVLVLILGIATGTYSSIFVAAQCLVVWEKGEIGRFFNRVLGKKQPAVS
ncbi:MAG: protein translocase subunit SecF [Dehalococcoidia bacterium]|nr:protein translocase subunit SecF [Dehalococcoidia bacterium]